MNKDTSIRMAEIRAKALLTISLTSRNDLIIEELTNDFGFDFIVRIAKNGEVTNRMFGVQLKASVRDMPAHIHLSLSNPLIYKDIPFPLCLFYFSMANDKGYYKWLVAPDVSPTGTPLLTIQLTMMERGAAGTSPQGGPSRSH